MPLDVSFVTRLPRFRTFHRRIEAARAATRRPNDLSRSLSLIAAVVVLTLAAGLGSRRRSGETAETLGGRVRRGTGGSEHLVPGRWRRADAGRADAGVAGLLAEAAALIGQTGDVGGALEATEVAATADHVLDHTAKFLAALAGVLDHHRLAEVAPFRDETHVTAPQ